MKMPERQKKVLSDINPELSFKQLQSLIQTNTQIPPSKQKLCVGFPPQQIHPNNDGESNDSKTIVDLGIKHGKHPIYEYMYIF